MKSKIAINRLTLHPSEHFMEPVASVLAPAGVHTGKKH